MEGLDQDFRAQTPSGTDLNDRRQWIGPAASQLVLGRNLHLQLRIAEDLFTKKYLNAKFVLNQNVHCVND